MSKIDRLGISLLPGKCLPSYIPPEESRMVVERLREHIGQILPNSLGMTVRYVKGAIIPVYPPVLSSIMRFSIEQLRSILLTRSVFQKSIGYAEMADVVTEESRIVSEYVPVKPPRNARRGIFNPAVYEKVYLEKIRAFGENHSISQKDIIKAQQIAAVSAMYVNPIRNIAEQT